MNEPQQRKLTVLYGKGLGAGRSSGPSQRLAAALVVLHAAEMAAGQRLTRLAEHGMNTQLRGELLENADVCRCTVARTAGFLASRRTARLFTPEVLAQPRVDVRLALCREAGRLHALALRYASTAELARQQCDIAAAWLCEVNRADASALATRLLALADALEAAP